MISIDAKELERVDIQSGIIYNYAKAIQGNIRVIIEHPFIMDMVSLKDSILPMLNNMKTSIEDIIEIISKG